MSSADTNPVAIPQDNSSHPPSPCPKKMAKAMQQAKLVKSNNQEIEQKGDNDQHECIQDVLNIGPGQGAGKTATLQAQIESSSVPMDINSKDKTIQGKPDKETQGFEIPISTDTKPVGTPQMIDAALWKKRLLLKMYSQAMQDIQNAVNEDRQAMDGQDQDGKTEPAEESATKTPMKIQIGISSTGLPPPAETPDEIHGLLLVAKATNRKANTGQVYYCLCRCCCQTFDTLKKMIKTQVQTTSAVLSYKDLTAKLRDEAKKTDIKFWLPFKPARKKKVISTLIKSRQTPNLWLSDVHNVIAGSAKHRKCKNFTYISYENCRDNPKYF
ncbi:uncharacterized protein [Drosophila pseudoobscura]|uniref:Uncharacterized protein isoform X1 n=1 Tax=Drosophila pseudoobscura pseudoobscura TaxID=46245 RepID=A0A6I8VIX7_DROPS|nr:uncharacterized protein LOC6901736 isoform X1 [Drosophila pseudoobscura]